MKLDVRELRPALASLDRKLAALDGKLIGGLAATRVWMLLQSAAILGVMAGGFGWL